MIQALLKLSGQAIFNILISILGALVELWPAFGNWWNENRWRDLYFLGACIVLATAVLVACHFGVAVENCAAPVEANEIAAGFEAVAIAYGLYNAARMFVRGGLYSVRRLLAR
jgi:hypothetical protein